MITSSPVAVTTVTGDKVCSGFALNEMVTFAGSGQPCTVGDVPPLDATTVILTDCTPDGITVVAAVFTRCRVGVVTRPTICCVITRLPHVGRTVARDKRHGPQDCQLSAASNAGGRLRDPQRLRTVQRPTDQR